ncbi:hypothetical protein M0813_05414 [Anaeramoeba flamelloides]|uniref:DUF659 domain-containing protein n=1 Tax=Anaeramoeba flamelloides TaxID=1746091 RepID=A0ABQ8XGX0_9EUKA|nr:hypothetical protein M0813_05414 [Anaeramoeba flamelloides]
MNGKKSTLLIHLKSKAHKKSLLYDEKEFTGSINEELVSIFFQNGINLHKGAKLLNNRNFIKLIKYNSIFPSAPTLRRSIPSIFEKEKERIKNKLKERKFSLIFDETTISNSRSIIGLICSSYEESICLRVTSIQKCDAVSIYNFISENIKLYSIDFNQILSLISDGAAVCLAVGKHFQAKKFHMLSVAHTPCI